MAIFDTVETSRGVRVLLVHGEAAAREQLAGGLAREGLRLTFAVSADEALRRFRMDAPDVVVLHGEEAAFDALARCGAVRERAGPGGAALVVLGHRVDDPPVVAASAATPL